MAKTKLECLIRESDQKSAGSVLYIMRDFKTEIQTQLKAVFEKIIQPFRICILMNQIFQ